MTAAAEQVGRVSDELLEAGHKEHLHTWPTYGGDWAQTRYSPLDQIRRENVGRLRPAWIAQTGVIGSFETTPVVLGREMYVTTPAEQGIQHVLRLDSTTGAVVWRVKLKADEAGRTAAAEDLHLPTDFGPSRGVAVYGDRVYVATLNGTLLALERATGNRVFEVKTLSPRLTGAPLAARGRIVVGLSWLERGAIQAFDAESGKLAWTWYTIPSPEEGGWLGEWVEKVPGRDISLERNVREEKANQPRFADAWKKGGAAAPMTPTFDAARQLLYVSTGGPDPHGFPPPTSPYPGDMRWTNAVCALHVETGRAAWCQQVLPHDVWGASGTTPPFLIRFNGDGATRDAVARFTGMGNLFVWDRETGALLKVSDNYMPVNETRGGKSGVNLIKGGLAGTVWSPGAYSFHTGFAYSVNQRVPGYFDPRENKRTGERYGSVSAVDPASGQVMWQHRTDQPLGGGLVATGGGLVFAGQTSGWFDAYDDKTGDQVWSFRIGAGCNAAPITYRVGGQQYVAVACGGHEVLDPEGGDTIVAFALVP